MGKKGSKGKHSARRAPSRFVPSPQPAANGWWKYAPHLLAAGLALRLLVALTSNWAMRPDEAIQYLEQAHRLVFGYGFVPWEFNYGARSWLIPAVPSLPLFAAKWLGVDSPGVYIPLVNSWNALISMVLPVGMYCYVRRAFSETAGRWALVFGCFWYEFIVFSPHALAEAYAATCFMAALALGGGAFRRFPAGFLLGMVCAFRPSYSLLVAVYGVLLLSGLPPRQWLPVLAGGVCALLSWVAVDFLTWGGLSLINYYEMLGLVYDEGYEDYKPLKLLSLTSAGLYPLIVVAAAFLLRRRGWPLFLLLGASLADSTAISGAEYTNAFIALPIFWMLAAVVAVAGRLPRGVFAAVGGLSLLGLLNLLPFVPPDTFGNGVDKRPLVFLETAAYQTTAEARQLLEDEQPAAIFWAAAGDALAMGGYYQLHRNVPLFFAGDYRHRELLAETPPERLFSHVVALERPPGFTPAPHAPLFRNDSPPPPIPAGYSYNIIGNYYVNRLQKGAKRARVKLPPLTENPFNPEIK